jgi:hypothetical protein
MPALKNARGAARARMLDHYKEASHDMVQQADAASKNAEQHEDEEIELAYEVRILIPATFYLAKTLTRCTLCSGWANFGRS